MGLSVFFNELISIFNIYVYKHIYKYVYKYSLKYSYF